MKINDDKVVKNALSYWHEEATSCAHEDISIDCFQAPEMTPIEQIVFFVLKAKSCWDYCKVFPQVQIGKYRVDFIVEIDGLPQTVIECDGHDFHEKTKEQAQKDKKRDRELQALGFRVYRFTGSEIWKSFGNCVIEALDI